MAQQPDLESRIARRIRLQRARRQGLHQPTGPGCAGRLRGAGAQQQGRDARSLGRQRKPARRCEIEQAGIAPGLDQRCTERTAARGFRPGAQDALRIACPHQQHAAGIEPEFRQAGRMQRAGFGIQIILPHPQNRSLPRRPQSQADGKAGCCREIGRARGINLMQRSPDQPAAQHLIKPRNAKTDPALGHRRRAQPCFGKAAAQIGQGAGSGYHEGSNVNVLSLFFYRERLCGRRVMSGWRIGLPEAAQPWYVRFSIECMDGPCLLFPFAIHGCVSWRGNSPAAGAPT